MKKLKNDPEILYRAIVCINLLVLLLMVVLCFNDSIWKDEVFDLQLIKNPYSYFVFSSKDSAPPLHFIILKTFVDVICGMIPSANPLIVAKISSVVPFILLFVLSHTLIKKEWGEAAGTVFGMLITSMPSLFTYSINIRQYSWSMFVTVLWFISFWYLIKNESVESAILAGIMGPLALWTHYFVFFGIAFAYVTYFIYSLIKHEKKGTKAIVITGIISVAIYIWWIIAAFGYIVENATTEFNIIVNSELVRYTLMCMMQPDSNKFNIGFILGIVGYVLLILLLIWYTKVNKEADKERLLVYIGIGIPFAVSICGLLIGRFIVPCFQPRYLVPVLGVFWLAYSILITGSKLNAKWAVIFIGFLSLIAFIDIYKGTKDELEYKRNIEAFEAFLDENEGTFILDDSRVDTCLPFYTDRSWYVAIDDLETPEDEEELIIEEALSNVGSDENIYYIRSEFNTKGKDLTETLKAKGCKLTKVHKGGIEYLFFDIYRLDMAQ